MILPCSNALCYPINPTANPTEFLLCLGYSDYADDDLTDTSETLNNKSTTEDEDELDDMTEDPSPPHSCY